MNRKTAVGKFASLALAMVALTGCDQIFGPIGEARKAVRAVLIDPDSAQFSDEVVTDHMFIGDKSFDESGVCGFVNAKNRMGGYVGRSPYIYNKTLGATVLMQPPTADDLEQVKQTEPASPLWQERYQVIQSGCNTIDRWQRQCPSNVRFPASYEPVRLCTLWSKRDSTIDSVLSGLRSAK